MTKRSFLEYLNGNVNREQIMRTAFDEACKEIGVDATISDSGSSIEYNDADSLARRDDLFRLVTDKLQSTPLAGVGVVASTQYIDHSR